MLRPKLSKGSCPIQVAPHCLIGHTFWIRTKTFWKEIWCWYLPRAERFYLVIWYQQVSGNNFAKTRFSHKRTRWMDRLIWMNRMRQENNTVQGYGLASERQQSNKSPSIPDHSNLYWTPRHSDSARRIPMRIAQVYICTVSLFQEWISHDIKRFHAGKVLPKWPKSPLQRARCRAPQECSKYCGGLSYKLAAFCEAANADGETNANDTLWSAMTCYDSLTCRC